MDRRSPEAPSGIRQQEELDGHVPLSRHFAVPLHGDKFPFRPVTILPPPLLSVSRSLSRQKNLHSCVPGTRMVEFRLKLPILLSILAAAVTLVLKWTAYFFTGSAGLLSDAAETAVNLMAALTALFSLWYASRPVDPTHTYGHEKIEYLSSGLEGMLILMTAAGLAWYDAQRLLNPRPLEALGVGVTITLVASLINFVVAQILLRVGKRHQSIVLEADGRHLMSDVWTSCGVVAGLVLVWLTDHRYLWVDAVVGLIVAVAIAYTGFDLVWRSFNGLMDHALPLTEQGAVRRAIE